MQRPMDSITLDEALAIAGAAAGVREAATALRARFAPLRVVVVNAFDMRAETPAAGSAAYQLYFAASDGHCWRVTNDAAGAAGLLIAQRG